MRLTNTIRDAFIRRVMDDLPKVDYSEKVRKILMEVAVRSLPMEVQKLWKDADLKKYVPQYILSGGWGTGHSILKEIYPIIPSIQVPGVIGEMRFLESEVQELKSMVAQFQEKSKKETELVTKLQAIVYSVNTRKALKELLPEFEKYLPLEISEPSKNPLAIIGVVQEFRDAGWPKDKNKDNQVVV